ncbi:Phosphotransferase enzyme family [Chlamydia abortus]|nr:Phosphotransferase enzyme family [Chlamydia abortus]
MNIVLELMEELRRLNITRFEGLSKGFSTAQKYVLYSKDDAPQYLLKIYGMDKAERCKIKFDLLKRHFDNAVSCQRPIQFGIHDELQVCYIVLSYVQGESGDKSIPSKSVEEQYTLGVLAGKELKTIHRVTPAKPYDWYHKRTQKYRNKVDECKRRGLTFYRQDFIEQYIQENIHWLKDSPVTFQHDDFHPQNMIVKSDGTIAIIDFDSYDWGDPFEEFFKLPKYTIYLSVSFAKGQVDGYFDHKIPETFWRKYNLFVALNQHASQLGGVISNNLAYVQERTRSIIETHDFHNNGAPDWYTRCPV